MSAWWKVTFDNCRACDRAAARDSAETSMEVKDASGLLAARMTVCAPTPQPASSTRLPGA
jgi:hypothetical protein